MKSPCCNAEMEEYRHESKHDGYIHKCQLKCTKCGTWYACVLAKEGDEKSMHL